MTPKPLEKFLHHSFTRLLDLNFDYLKYTIAVFNFQSLNLQGVQDLPWMIPPYGSQKSEVKYNNYFYDL